MKVCVAGGAGYVGSALVPALLKKGYDVVVLDLFIYGEEVFNDWKEHPKLQLIKGDIRDAALNQKALREVDVVIHLACISNDPSFELNPDLGKSINLDSFEPFVIEAKKQGVKRFIYASSSSVYGIKSEANVTEEMSLEPLTDYSKFKALCEEILFKHQTSDFVCTVIRPATVCGYAKRQRLDVIVNILTNLAYNTGKIKVMGGSQMRPNIHIQDMVRAYISLLEAPKELVAGERFNAGYHNHKVIDLGKMVERLVSEHRDVQLDIIPTNDDRSYHISSDKIRKKLNFSPEHTIEDAVKDLIDAFQEKKLPNSLANPLYFNIKRMKEIQLV